MKALGGQTRGADGYNGSSLAIGLNASSRQARPAPQLLISNRYATVASASGMVMFQGLDARVRGRDRSSTTVSFVAHVLIITLVLWWGMAIHNRVAPIATTVTPLDFTLYDPPPPVMKVARASGGGGGGGEHHLVAPTRGNLPKIVRVRPSPEPPQLIRYERPKLPVEPTMQVRIPESNRLPNLGMPQSPQVALASQGSGRGSGFGFGMGGSIGMGHGSGAGPGSGGGYGGGLMSVGGGVSAPQVIHSVEANFTDEARRADFQGTASIQLIVDSQGNPQDVRVVHHLGMGLDEKAVDAVRRYRFRPAMYQGHPVSVQMVIEVEFRLH